MKLCCAAFKKIIYDHLPNIFSILVMFTEQLLLMFFLLMMVLILLKGDKTLNHIWKVDVF